MWSITSTSTGSFCDSSLSPSPSTKPDDSHVARTDQDEFGHIFRRNMPYGNVDNHGTVSVVFSAEQQRLIKMLESMVGLVNGPRNALTRYTQPLTGVYYFVPSWKTYAS